MSKHQCSGFTRRQLLHGTGMTALGAAALSAPQQSKAFGILSTPEALPATTQIASVCEVCFWNCGIVAHVRGNRLLELRGHPDYPNARGKLCARGNAGPGFASDPDRLKYPMRRVGKRGEGAFERIGWPLAYALIAERFAHVKEQYGPQSLALFYHGKGGPLLRSMMVAYGTPNYAAPAYAQCKGPRDVGRCRHQTLYWTAPTRIDVAV